MQFETATYSLQTCAICKSPHLTTKLYKTQSYLVCRSCQFAKVNCDTTIDIYRNNEVSTLEYYEKRAAEDRIDFAERISWISASFSPGRILDVGANIGTFCQIAREQGWTPTAIELNGNAANRCRAQGFDVWEQTLEQMPDKKYDFIHLSDVIEHVEDPLELLHNANRLTAPGSGIFVSTPDFGNPLVWPIQFTPPEHISLFNHRSLLAALENASFRVLNVRRRSRTRAFHANGRVTQRYSLIKHAYDLIGRLRLDGSASKFINFFLRENLEFLAVRK